MRKVGGWVDLCWGQRPKHEPIGALRGVPARRGCWKTPARRLNQGEDFPLIQIKHIGVACFYTVTKPYAINTSVL